MRRALFAASAAVVGFAGGVQAQTLSDPAAFASAIEAVRNAAHSTDKFAEPPTLPIDGKSFRLTAPAKDGTEGQGAVVYDYKDGTLTLDVSPTKLWPTLTGPSEALPAFMVAEDTKNLGSYVGQNAFGATARVTSFKSIGAAIALVSSPKPMLSPIRTSICGALLEDTDWWVRLQLAPAEAKALALDSIGIIEGTYTRLPSGKAGACHFGGVSATINRPTNYSSEVCYIGAHVKRIALARRSTGEIIKEWTLDNSPRLGATLWGNIQAGMNMRELRERYPAITSYGYLEAEGAQVRLSKDVVSSVEVRNWPARGKRLARLLTDKYGQPVELNCDYDSICEGRWKVSEGVSAYLTLLGWVSYQPTGSGPPTGYSGRRR